MVHSLRWQIWQLARRFQGHVLGKASFNLDLWGWIAGFDLLLIENVANQAVSLDIRYVLSARDSGKLITLARLAPFLARASLAAIRSPHVKHEALFGYLGMVMLKAVRSLGTGARRSSGGAMTVSVGWCAQAVAEPGC